MAGKWAWDGPDGKRYSVELEQKYQEVSGTAAVDGKMAPLLGSKLRGNRLALEIELPDGSASSSFTLDFADGELASVSGREIPRSKSGL